MGGHVTRMGEIGNVYRIFVTNPKWKRPRGRPKRRWDDDIKMDFKEMAWEVADWMHLAQDRNQWHTLCEYGNEPSESTKAGNFLTRRVTICFSRRCLLHKVSYKQCYQ